MYRSKTCFVHNSRTRDRTEKYNPQMKAHDKHYHLHTLVQPGGPSPGGGGLR